VPVPPSGTVSGLTGGGVVPSRRIDFRHRVGACRDGIGDLPLAVGGIGLVDTVTRHPELQAGHTPSSLVLMIFAVPCAVRTFIV